MVPLALMGGFAMDAHVAALSQDRNRWANAIDSCYEAGINDWLRIRKADECVMDENEWPLFLLEYKAALCLDPTAFEKSHPARLVLKAMEEYCLWRTDVFGVHLPQRLQLALLHIEHLPPNSSAYDNELAAWQNASPQLRIKASPEIGTYYNLMQDPQMLRWHLKNIDAPDTTSYALPDNLELGASI